MKFKVGEIAIVALQPDRPDVVNKGDEVLIIGLPGETRCSCCGAFRSMPSNYTIEIPKQPDGRKCASIPERALRKRPQPGIPDAILRIFEVEAKQERPA